MISLIVEEYCQNCPEFHPESITNALYIDNMDGREIACFTNVFCMHKDTCAKHFDKKNT